MVTAIRSLLFLLAPLIVYANEAGIVSLRPLYTSETTVLNPALTGLWTDAEGEFGITFRIQPDVDSGYEVLAGGQKFLAFHLVPLGGETIADIVINVSQDLLAPLVVHYFARLRVDGDRLQADFLGGEKLLQQIERTGSPRFERLTEGDCDGSFLILPASTAELRQFVLDCLKQPDAFGSSTDMAGTYKRAGPKKRAADLNQQSWETVSSRGAKPEAYTTALHQAEEAISLVPDEPDYWSTLGAAQYRVGAFTAALATLAHAAQLREFATIEDLIFRAMSHQQAGHKEEAKAVLLDELSKILGDPRYLGDLQRYCGEQDKQSLLREAENLIMPKGK